MASPGYDISASDASSQTTDPFEDSATTFVFGNGDNATSSPSQTTSSTPTAVVASAEKGNASAGATVSAPTGSGGAVPAASTSSSGLSLTTIAMLAGGAFLALHFLRHKAAP